MLTLYQLQADAFTSDHKRILLNISAKAGTVIENALKFEQVQDEARLDELTGLLNSRSLFEGLDERVASCSERSGSVAVVVMDLDGFKMANDEHGHVAGDRVLHMWQPGSRSTAAQAIWSGGGEGTSLLWCSPIRVTILAR